MDLPSLSDLLFTILLLIPGFVTLSIFRQIGRFDRTLSDNEKIYWSLFSSLLIIGTYNWGKSSIDISKLSSELLLFENVFRLIIISIIYGVVPGYVVRRVLKNNIISKDCWEIAFSNASKSGTWVLVYTNNDEEYMGELHYNSGSEDPRELTIRNPYKITRRSDGVTEEKKWGEEILFPEKDVRRVVFFEKV